METIKSAIEILGISTFRGFVTTAALSYNTYLKCSQVCTSHFQDTLQPPLACDTGYKQFCEMQYPKKISDSLEWSVGYSIVISSACYLMIDRPKTIFSREMVKVLAFKTMAIVSYAYFMGDNFMAKDMINVFKMEALGEVIQIFGNSLCGQTA